MRDALKRYHQPFRPGKDNPPGIMPWQIERWTGNDRLAIEGGVVVEEPLEIRLDGRPVAVLMRTPGMEKELAVGFVLGEGIVANLEDIALVRHCGRAVPDEAAEGDALDESRNLVDVTLMPSSIARYQAGEVLEWIRSGCGRAEVAHLVQDLSPIKSDAKVSLSVLPPLLGRITRQQAAYRVAGGIHAAAVFETHGRPIIVCEDIGRHNAVDKAMGHCLLRGISLRDKLLISTGRASYDMVAKGTRLGVPIMASISSPTSLAVELADALNCTLLGYLRGKAVNVYTHGGRVIFPNTSQ